MNEVEIKGDLNWRIEKILRDVQKYAQAALYAGASVIKGATKSTFQSKLPAASQQNPKYSDTLLDAVRNSRTEGDVVTIHILGTRQSSSGTYRARFFENGTKYRKQRTWRGKPLKKRRNLGKLPALRYFSSAVSSSETQAIAKMQEIINHLFENAYK